MYQLDQDTPADLAASLSAAQDRAAFTQARFTATPDLELNDPLCTEAALAALVSFDESLGGFESGAYKADEDLLGLSGSALAGGENARARDFRIVLAASTKPGTDVAGKTARLLAEKSVQLAALADRRAAVTAEARKMYAHLINRVGALDVQEARLRAAGQDAQADRVRKEALVLGRRAIRYQKVNALASALTQNAIAQGLLAQQAAGAVLAGRPDLVAPIGVMYDKLGSASARIRALRERQIAKARTQGLDGLDAIFEGEVQTELSELEGRIGRWFKRKARAVKKVAKKVTRPVKNAVRTVAKKVGKAAAKVFVGLPCKFGQSSIGRAAAQAAGTAVGTYFGGPTGGAVGGRAGLRANDFDRSVCGALDRIGITEGKFRRGEVGRALKGAAMKIAKDSLSPKKAFEDAKAVGMTYATGGAGGSMLQNYGTDALKKFGLSKLGEQFQQRVGREIAQQGSRAVQRLVTQQVRRTLATRVRREATDLVQGALKQASPVLAQQAPRLARIGSLADEVFG